MATRSALPVLIACGVVGLFSLLALGIQAGQVAGHSPYETSTTSQSTCQGGYDGFGNYSYCNRRNPGHTTTTDHDGAWASSLDKAVLGLAVVSLIWSPLSTFLYWRARTSARFASHLLLQAAVSGVFGLILLALSIAKMIDDRKYEHNPSPLQNAGAASGFILGLGRVGLAVFFVLLALRARSASQVASSGVEQGNAAKSKQAMAQGTGVPVLAYQPSAQPAYPAYSPSFPTANYPGAPISPLSSPPPPPPPMAVSPVAVEAPRRPALTNGDSVDSRKHTSSGRPSRSASYQTYPQHINYEAANPSGRTRSPIASDQKINIDLARAYDKEMAKLDRILRRSGAAEV